MEHTTKEGWASSHIVLLMISIRLIRATSSPVRDTRTILGDKLLAPIFHL